MPRGQYPRYRRPVADRLRDLRRLEPETGCWIWQGTMDLGGYGRITMCDGASKARRKAHIVSWEQVHGPVPPGRVLDHLCRNRACCNPEHLEAVTHRENVLRGVSPIAAQAAKTHCDRGHALAGENLHIDNRGRRSCRECRRSYYWRCLAEKKEAPRGIL